MKNPELVSALTCLKEIGAQVAELSLKSKELRYRVVSMLAMAGYPLPKPARADDERGPPLKIRVGNEIVTVSEALIMKDYSVTFETLPEFTSDEEG